MVAYLDHAATTPVCVEASHAMEPWLSGRFGNPSGSHSVARSARQAIDEARDTVASCLGTSPGDVVFTGSGTEAANLAVLGRVRAFPGPVVVSAIEHHAVLHAAEAAGRSLGVPVRVVGVTSDGVVDLNALSAALDRDVSIVSVQLVNNEVGTVQPVAEVVRLVRRRAPGAVVHTDAVQAVPWFDVARLAGGADMVSISAHKFGGPQGVGALALRRPVKLEPLIYGGPRRGNAAPAPTTSPGSWVWLRHYERRIVTGRLPGSGCAPFATASQGACWRALPGRTKQPPGKTRPPAIATWSSMGSRARRCSSCSMAMGWRLLLALRVPAAR